LKREGERRLFFKVPLFSREGFRVSLLMIPWFLHRLDPVGTALRDIFSKLSQYLQKRNLIFVIIVTIIEMYTPIVEEQSQYG